MSIRIRGGLDSEFDKSKMVPRELVVLNSGKMFFCYSAGNVKQVATSEDLQEMLDSSATTYAALQQLIADLELNPSELTNILSNIASLQADKLDKTGNSQTNTVTFTEAVADTDIATGDSHATLFGKILKRFNVITTALGLKQTIANMVQNDTTNDTTKYPSAAVAYAHGLEIDAINNNMIKVATKEYTVTSGSTIDSVTGLYAASINISADKPVGTIISCFAQAPALQAYFSLGAIVGATTNGNDVRVGTLIAGRTVVVQVTWLYK